MLKYNCIVLSRFGHLLYNRTHVHAEANICLYIALALLQVPHK